MHQKLHHYNPEITKSEIDKSESNSSFAPRVQDCGASLSKLGSFLFIEYEIFDENKMSYRGFPQA